MTNNIKAQVFAMYWGQRILKLQEPELYNVGILITTNLDNAFLELRSISMLTDEEAITCANIGFSYFKNVCGHELKVIRELRRISVAAIADAGKTCLVKIEISNEWKLNIAQIDYLRSIGIALPITVLIDGKPTTLTVADLEREGVIKIVEV